MLTNIYIYICILVYLLLPVDFHPRAPQWFRKTRGRRVVGGSADKPHLACSLIGRGRHRPVRTAANVARVEELICSQEDAPPTRVLGKLSGKHLYSMIVVCCRRYNRWTICRSATYNFFQVVCLRQSCWSYVAPSSALKCLLWQKIFIKFASHHLLLYVVYMCQKSLNFTNAFKCYQRKCK